MRTISLPHAQIVVFADAAELSRAAADEFLRVARKTIREQDRFMVALAGGSTPKAVYMLLAEGERGGVGPLNWEKVHAFFGDERHVPPEHSESNFRMANDALLAKLPIHVHRVRAELDAATASSDYAAELKSAFALRAGEVPRFDLMMLGMGPDGHTASLFPGSAALEDRGALVAANWVEKFKAYRITLTFPVLNAATEVLFTAGGADKAEMLRNVLRGDPTGEKYPAQLVRPSAGQLLWFVDEAAARLL